MAGFARPTTTQTPDALFDHWLSRLTGAELRVILYAVRRTFGFRKDQDAISREQFLRGIRTKDGRVLDEGTGIGSGTTLSKAIGSLPKFCANGQKARVIEPVVGAGRGRR